MKSLKQYILSLLAMLLAVVSCSGVFDDVDMPEHEDGIVLHFNASGVAVKGTEDDNPAESYMTHIDVIIYKYGGVVNEHEVYTGFHHQRVQVSSTPNGSVTIQKTKQDFDENIQYKFFVIANSTHTTEIYYNGNGSLISYEDFLKLDQTDKKIHLTGLDFDRPDPRYPKSFLMDGVAYIGKTEPVSPGRIVINDGDSDEVELNVVLRRAAAKIVLTVTPGDKVVFTKELMAQSHGYLIRNMPMRTTLVAEGKYPSTYQESYWESTTISQSPYFNVIDVTDAQGVVRDGVQLIAYIYSHSWDKEEVFEKGTSVVMMLPLKYKESEDKEEVVHINNYYQLSISNNPAIKRNTIYDLRVTLNAPGAEDITEPETMKDIMYFTAPWQKVGLPVSGESEVKYLKVNKKKMYMYNVADDNTTLYFSSSSPVTVQMVSKSAHYYNKYNVKQTLADNAAGVSGSSQTGATSGNISVHSDIPTNNTIKYFQLKVTNEEGMSEIIDVEQYPLIYITNNLPWYSYRDDYYYRASGGHQWNGNVSSSPATGDLPTTYQYDGDHIVSIYKINDVDVTTKTVKYTYSSAAASSSNGGTGWTVSKVRGNKQNNSENYAIQYYYFEYKSRKWSKKETNCENHNVRNYHVRMMATSGDYTLARPALDEYGYTAGDEHNAKLVSPSFVIASRLGAVLSTYSGLSSMSNEKKLIAFADHCKNYVEVDDVNDDKKDPVVVYDNWRLPTEAEIKIIIDIQGTSGQNADAIDYLLNGGYYMSASGPVFNPKNTDSTNELADPMQATGVAIRCVRDAF